MNSLYAILLSLTGITCLSVAGLVWQKRQSSQAAYPLVLLLLALAFWDLTYAIFWTGASGPTLFFWLDITYLGVVTVPTFFFVFAAVFSQAVGTFRKPFLWALTIEPAFVLVALWTDPWHNLFFGGTRAVNAGVILEGGPVFYLNVAYSYSLVLVATVFLIRAFQRSSGIFRKQTVMILLGMAVIWINSILLLFRLGPLPNADHTPFSFSLAALAFAYALLQYRLLTITPIARDVLVENMKDGVMVLDANDYIIDLNPAAVHSFAFLKNLRIGASFQDAFVDLPNVLEIFTGRPMARTEITLTAYPSCLFDFQVTPIFDRQKRLIGRLVVWRDISERKRLEEELERQATTDSLTGIFNRRHFLRLAQVELERSLRLGHHLSLLQADIDHFKQVNDQFGHAVGDQVLLDFAYICKNHLRSSDLVARFGGDEFVLLLPETGFEEAQIVASRICKDFASAAAQQKCAPLNVTVSFGISGRTNENDTLETLLVHADQALYRAKNLGRDQIVRDGVA